MQKTVRVTGSSRVRVTGSSSYRGFELSGFHCMSFDSKLSPEFFFFFFFYLREMSQ